MAVCVFRLHKKLPPAHRRSPASTLKSPPFVHQNPKAPWRVSFQASPQHVAGLPRALATLRRPMGIHPSSSKTCQSWPLSNDGSVFKVNSFQTGNTSPASRKISTCYGYSSCLRAFELVYSCFYYPKSAFQVDSSQPLGSLHTQLEAQRLDDLHHGCKLGVAVG